MGVPQYCLISSIYSHRNSTCTTLEHLVEQKYATEKAASEVDTLQGDRQFSIKEWLTLSQMIEALKLFKEFTKALFCDTANVGLVTPLI